MSLDRSWQLGATDGPVNRFYDWLRRGLNARLVRYLSDECLRETRESNATRPVRVLESGSGTAFASSLFARQRGVDACVCLDMDEAALREGRRRDPSLRAVVGDMMQLPFRDESFALVFNSSTVEHLEEPHLAVDEMNRVCRPDGRVFVGVPYLFGPLAFQPMIRATRAGHWLGPVFSRDALYRLLRRARLHPVGHIRYFWRFFIGAVATKVALPSRSAEHPA